MKSEFQNSIRRLSYLFHLLGQTPVTELTWYLLQALLLSRPCLEEVLTSLCSQSWAYGRQVRAYSRHLLGATIALNLVPWVLKKKKLLEMVKNDICLGCASKQNAFFPKKYAPKNAPMPSLSRIGPASMLIGFDHCL